VTEPLLTTLLAFVEELRAAGVTAGTDRVALAVVALAELPGDPRAALRPALCLSRVDELIFDAVWAAGAAEVALDGAPVTGHAAADGAAPLTPDTTVGRTEDAAAGSEAADLRTRDVTGLTPDQLDEIRRLIDRLAPIPRRASMRRVPSAGGRIDARRTLRLMLRNGGEPRGVLTARRARRPRSLFMLIDVSGSMGGYTDVMLRFAHAAVAARPATTEVFALGTGARRITAELRQSNTGDAMSAVAGVEAGWGLGTRLGPALRELLREWGGRTAVRSAVIVLSSDGNEAGDLAVLPAQVARLARLGHILIWVNPAMASPGYRPVNPALKASLEHAGEKLTGHSYDALRHLAEVISR
jgi:uncharacterized protein with von Willebrand factor type A (vWA) domain